MKVRSWTNVGAPAWCAVIATASWRGVTRTAGARDRHTASLMAVTACYRAVTEVR